MTYVDLDKSNIGTSTDNVATGPTLGTFPQLVNGSRVITAAGTYTVLPYDRILLCSKTVPAAFSIQLPDVALWMKNQYGLLPITVVDLAANAGTYNITVLPFGSQTINGAASYSIATNSACVTFMPLNTLAGWVIIASNLASALSNTAVTPGTYGSTTQVGQFTVQADGRLTAAGNLTIAAVTSLTEGTGIDLTPNTITTTGSIGLANTAVTPTTYGDSTHVPQFTVDAQGRLTAASNVAISYSGFMSLSAAGQSFTGGVTCTSHIADGGAGNLTSFTVDPGLGPYQYGTNHGAITITAPAADGGCDILITNDGSAGTITFTGFTVGSNTGDTYGTTNTNKFILSVRRINSVSTYVWKALQ